MIKTVTIINFLGEILHLTLSDPEPKSGMIISEIEGLGPPSADVNLTEIASGDGGVYNSSRAHDRNIVMSLIFTFQQTIEDVRLLTYKYFPLKKPLIFRIETDNRLAEILGYVESNEPEIFEQQEVADISIICPDPWFYSIGKNETVFSGVRALFEFPFENYVPDSKDIFNITKMSYTGTHQGITASVDESNIITITGNTGANVANVLLNAPGLSIEFKKGNKYMLEVEPIEDPNTKSWNQIWIRPNNWRPPTSSKNLVRLMHESAERIAGSGLNFTVNDDYSITVNGKYNNIHVKRFGQERDLVIYDVINTEIFIKSGDRPYTLETGDYILSDGGASFKSNGDAYLTLTIKTNDDVTHYDVSKLPETPQFHIDKDQIKHIYLGIAVKPDAQIDHLTFYPMIRSAEDTNTVYEPNYYYVDGAFCPVKKLREKRHAIYNMPRFKYLSVEKNRQFKKIEFVPWMDFTGGIGVRVDTNTPDVGTVKLKVKVLEVREIEFGSIELRTEQTVVYNGDVETGIVIQMHALGPVGDITIYNMNTRGKLTLESEKIAEIVGTAIKRSDDIVVSTIKGNVYAQLIRDGIVHNIFNAVTRGADWFQLQKGDNIFAYVAENGGEYLQFKIDARTAYEGV